MLWRCEWKGGHAYVKCATRSGAVLFASRELGGQGKTINAYPVAADEEPTDEQVHEATFPALEEPPKKPRKPGRKAPTRNGGSGW